MQTQFQRRLCGRAAGIEVHLERSQQLIVIAGIKDRLQDEPGIAGEVLGPEPAHQHTLHAELVDVGGARTAPETGVGDQSRFVGLGQRPAQPAEVGVGAPDTRVSLQARVGVNKLSQCVAQATDHHRVVLHRGFGRLGHPAAPSVVPLHQRPVEPSAAQPLAHLRMEIDDPGGVGSVQCDVEADVPPRSAPSEREHLVADVALMEVAGRQQFIEYCDPAPGVALSACPHGGQKGREVPGSDLQEGSEQTLDAAGPAALGHQPVVSILTRFTGGQHDRRAVERGLGGVVHEVGRTRGEPALANLDVIACDQAPVLAQQADSRRAEFRDGIEDPVHAGGVSPTQRDQQRVDR